MASRAGIDPEFDAKLLEAIVHAEAESAADDDTTIRAIDAAVTAAIARGVGSTPDSDVSESTDNGADDNSMDREDGP